jgi:hypothetical protein
MTRGRQPAGIAGGRGASCGPGTSCLRPTGLGRSVGGRAVAGAGVARARVWVHGAGRGASWQTSAGDEVEVGLEAGLRVAGHVPRRPRRERVEEPRAAGAAARVSRRTARKGARVQRHTVRREGEERGEGDPFIGSSRSRPPAGTGQCPQVPA